jgi:hypothetical protein
MDVFENPRRAITRAVLRGPRAGLRSARYRFADDRFRRLRVCRDVADGTLPNYSFVEPVYMIRLEPSEHQHPSPPAEGERLIAWVYDTPGNAAA